jgi:hypothetical protein
MLPEESVVLSANTALSGQCVVIPKFATGVGFTKIFPVTVSAQPPVVLAIRVTARFPAGKFGTEGFCDEEVNAPMVQFQDTTVPFWMDDASVNVAPPFAQIVALVKFATGVL